MLPSPEEPTHPASLRRLLSRFRAEARVLGEELAAVDVELAALHDDVARRRLAGEPGLEPLLRRCEALAAEHDHLAVELAHVRLAIAGASEELAARAEAPALAG